MTLRVVSSKDFKEFYADWCGPCRMLSPNIEKLSEEYKNIKFAKVNVDDCSELAQELGITSIPAVFFFKDAKVINSFVGFKPYEEIKYGETELTGEYLDTYNMIMAQAQEVIKHFIGQD